MPPKRSSKGKQKIELKKIEKKDDLFVAFTTRKSGIFNKASELTTLTGASVDILMLSPTGKPFCYGDPSSESITKTILNENPSMEEKMMKPEIIERNEKNDDLLDKKHVAEAQRKNLKVMETSGYWSTTKDQYDQVKEIDKSLVAVTNKLITNVLKTGGKIDPHAISTIEELNGVKTNLPYVFEDNTKDHEVGASKGMVANASQDIATKKSQGVNLIGVSGIGYGSGVDHTSPDI